VPNELITACLGKTDTNSIMATVILVYMYRENNLSRTRLGNPCVFEYKRTLIIGS